MSKKNGFMIPCDEANHTCDKTQYDEASIWEKIKLSIHLLYCRACRKYTTNNKKLSKLIANKEVECLNTVEKMNLKKVFDKELSNKN